nr:CynX/NimT family MFS transporter [uncultured Pseudomonas sp.]
MTTAWKWVLVALLALNLRPILTSIGPLLEPMRLSTGLGYQQAALLTALPVLCMGAVPLLHPWSRRWLTEHAGMLGGLGAVALACLWRLHLDSAWALIASAVLAGLGVAVVQGMMPGLVNRWFPGRLAGAMGLYSAALMSGGGLAAVLGPHLTEHFGYWQVGLGVWAAPATFAMLAWIFVRPRSAQGPAAQAYGGHWFGHRRAWLLAVYFGLINGGYTSMVAWLPAYYLEQGGSAQGGADLVGLMTIFQVLGALGLPLLLRRFADRRPGLALALSIQLVGFMGLLMAPTVAPGLWVSLIGFGLGACFSQSLTLTLEHLSTPAEAGSLAGFVQGIGFIITGCVPYIIGWLRALDGDFQGAWTVLTASVVTMLLVTTCFSPQSYAKAMARPAPRDAEGALS